MTNRNDPCPCGSGRKYKQCHGTPRSAAAAPPEVARAGVLKARDVAMGEALLRFGGRRYGAGWLQDALLAEALLVGGELPEGALPLVIPWLLHFRRNAAGATLAAEWRAAQSEGRTPRDDRLLLDAYEAAWLSIWEVAEIEPGTGSRLRDLLTGEERFVYDVASSHSLSPFDTMLAVVLTCDGVSFFGGVHAQPLPPREAAEVVRIARRLCRVRTRPVVPDKLREPGRQLELLDLWEEVVEDLLHQPPPALHNTDGDPFVLTSDLFDLFAPLDEVARRLTSVPGAQPPEVDGDSIVLMIATAGNALSKSRDNTVTGQLVLHGSRLTAATNSTRRADALRAAVETACGALVRFRLRKEENTAHLFGAEAAERPGSPRAAPAESPEVEAALRQFRQQHLREWLDLELPALDGLTPRQAAGQPRARPKLELLLKELAQIEGALPESQRSDTRWLHRELGFEGLLPD